MTSKINEDWKPVLVQKQRKYLSGAWLCFWCIPSCTTNHIMDCMLGGMSHALYGSRFLIVSSEQCLQLEDKSAQ